MRVLVGNLSDSASCNIRDRLLASDEWLDTGGRFRAGTIRQRGYDMLVEVDGPVIHDESLSEDLAATGWPIASVWFLSRHRAASGQPSLTAHPIGNHNFGEHGGRSDAVSPAAARDMGALLRRMAHHRDAADLPHSVTYEATHHGPHMDQPSVFVEVGSDETWYEEPAGAQAVAAAVTDVLDGGGACAGPVLVGVGGGHYVPRQTAKALAGEADFGHLIPGYAVDPDDEDPAILARAVAATPGCEGVYVHKKGLKGPQRQRVKAWMEALGIEAWDPRSV